jgi:hypothetical protein
MSEWDTTYGRFLRAVAMIGAIVGTLILGVIQIQFIFHVGFDFWKELVRDHFPATLGLQGAAIISFGVVIFLRQTEGPVEFEGLGMKFKGAAGQVVLWAFCIIVLALCGKLLWWPPPRSIVCHGML